MDIAKELLERHNLLQSRNLKNECPYPPPREKFRQLKIKTKLLDPTVITCALDTIDSYPITTTQVYNDGLAFLLTNLFMPVEMTQQVIRLR